jgi:hypothetical protein
MLIKLEWFFIYWNKHTDNWLRYSGVGTRFNWLDEVFVEPEPERNFRLVSVHCVNAGDVRNNSL